MSQKATEQMSRRHMTMNASAYHSDKKENNLYLPCLKCTMGASISHFARNIMNDKIPRRKFTSK